MMNDLEGQIAVVTGVTAGIGAVVARRLAERGAQVLAIGRDPARLRDVVEALPRATAQHRTYFADLSLVSEARRAASEIAAEYPRVDLLINNAGGLFPRRQITAEGLEKTFALNHMAYFVVTRELLPAIEAAPAGRIVSTASRLHAGGKIDFDDMTMARSYDGYAAYGRSKLCNMLFTRALAMRLAGTRAGACAVHPGFVNTRFGDDDRSAMGRLFVWMKRFAISPEDGAKTTLYAATAVDPARLNGAYFIRCARAQPSRTARDDALAERLWEMSSDLARRF